MSEFTIQTIIEAARYHGENSEPDHEIGDLQDALRVAYDLLSEEGRDEFWDSYAVGNNLELGWYEEEVPRVIETLITAAKQHGEDSEPDHEAGDLIDLLEAAWEVMSAEGRKILEKHETIKRNIDTAYPRISALVK